MGPRTRSKLCLGGRDDALRRETVAMLLEEDEMGMIQCNNALPQVTMGLYEGR